jgi:hypothetical protein
MNLGDILQGTSGQGIAQPASAPTPTQPPAQNAGGAGLAQRKQGWLGALQEMASDPATSMMMIQMGNSLLNPPAGTSQGGQISNAVMQGLGYYGRLKSQDEERAKTEREQYRQDRRVDMEGRRAGISEQQLGLDKERMAADADYRQKSLEIDKLRAEAAMVQAKKPAAANSASLTAKLKEMEKERIAAALRLNYPGMTPEQARQEVEYRAATQTKEDFVKETVRNQIDAYKTEAAIWVPGRGEKPTPVDPEAAAMRAAEVYDDQVNQRYGIGKPEAPAPAPAQGASPQNLTPAQIDAEADAAIRAGRDPIQVRAKAAELKRQLQTGGGF